MSRLPAEPDFDRVVGLIDSREQTPLDLNPLRTEPATLATGDYSVKGLEHVIAIERKSLGDLVSCCGTERERFEREIQRLIGYPVRCLVVESDWCEIEMRQWSQKSTITPKIVIGSLLGWAAAGIPLVMAGNHRRAGELVSRMLYIAARRRYREARGFVQSLVEEQPA